MSDGNRLERVEVVDDRSGRDQEAGFLRIRRLRLRNVYSDGSVGEPYDYDVVERNALDAVAVAAYDRTDHGAHVWLRRCLRPPLLSRSRMQVPIEWSGETPTLLEVPAGLVDPGELGWDGVRRAAARELREETGLDFPWESFRPLGEPFLLSPGVIGEMIFPLAVEVPSDARARTGHETEEVERGAEVLRMPLDEAIAKAGDGKTEIVLRRLREALG